MKRTSRFVATLFCLVVAPPASATIRYRISLAHPEQHVFHVQMSIPRGGPGTMVALPAWNALYQVRDFSNRVREVRASSNDAPLSAEPELPKGIVLQKVDKQTWRIPTIGTGKDRADVQVDYSVQWDTPGPFDSQLDSHHAFINFAEILTYIPDRRNEDCLVTFEGLPAGWRIAAELPAGSEPHSFRAASYDQLVDTPIEAGTFEELGFDERGAHFRVIVDAEEWKRNILVDSIRRIAAYELRLMRGAPFAEYTFFFHIGPYAKVGGGGMEHANSTAISADSVEAASVLAAHEFFHAWNVKRIRPMSLEPVDYTKEQYTHALWFAEGVTSTYGAYALLRSGLWTSDQWYKNLSDQITGLQSRPARLWQSVEESSLDAWLEKYDAYHLPDRSISYYNKGEILGVLLDLSIRDATDNHGSLDDVMRQLNDQFAERHRFYNDSEAIRGVVEGVAGKNFEDFFRRYVASTDEIPYAEFFSIAGLDLRVETHASADPGFLSARGAGAAAEVSQVAAGSAAEAAGLRVGDVLVEFNGKPFSPNFFRWIRERNPGETLHLRVRRDGKNLDLTFPLGARQEQRYTVSETPRPTDRQHRIREGLLRGATD